MYNTEIYSIKDLSVNAMESKHICLFFRRNGRYSTNIQVVRNDVAILTSGFDPGPGPFLDIISTSSLVGLPFRATD